MTDYDKPTKKKHKNSYLTPSIRTVFLLVQCSRCTGPWHFDVPVRFRWFRFWWKWYVCRGDQSGVCQFGVFVRQFFGYEGNGWQYWEGDWGDEMADYVLHNYELKSKKTYPPCNSFHSTPTLTSSTPSSSPSSPQQTSVPFLRYELPFLALISPLCMLGYELRIYDFFMQNLFFWNFELLTCMD